ncbi:hypothetical protein J7L05_02630 [bacterium]|nr:hypothetical protein [bacterium]
MRFVYIAVLLVFLLCGCSSGRNGVLPEKSSQFDLRTQEIDRAFPDFAVYPSEGFRMINWNPMANPANDAVLPKKPYPFLPPVRPLVQYAFVKANSPTSAFGKIYYSSGSILPEVIWENGHSPTPSGDWVYFIQPPGASPPGPARWNTVSETVEYLDTSMVDPPCNYLVPADGGNAYIYAAIGFDPPLQGSIHIVKNGETVWSDYGSYLFPTLSSDASTAAWCYSANPLSFGSRHPFVMDIETTALTQLHTCSSDEESQYVCLSADGSIAGFTVAINGPDGLHDQEAWRWQNGVSFKIDIGEYRWCEGMSISPEGKYQVFPSNKDPYEYAGYAVMCVFDGAVVAFEVTPWDSAIQDIWADVDGRGNIVFGHGVGYWSHYIPSRTHVNTGDIETIIDPGGISRDFKFNN